ncbi:hypothetical protein [Dietzia maris]|uniref:hypothetical protein n=1 Tax=Dietzia maris TaxID=37915 RepID=UPI0037C7E940
MGTDGLAALSLMPTLSLTALIPTAVGLVTSTSFWGAVAHSLGMLPEEAFIQAEQIGITLPPMPR